MNIRDAKKQECKALTRLAIRSKAYWGYDQAFMAACRAELTVSPEDFEREFIRVAETGEWVAGFYRLEIETGTAEIEAFFVDPDQIGKGVGLLLWGDLIAQIQARAVRHLICQSDPNAEGFYAAMGMVTTGKRESQSIPGRYLPLLELSL